MPLDTLASTRETVPSSTTPLSRDATGSTRGKAELVNLLILLNGVSSVIDLGRGDDLLADLLDVPLYIGVSIGRTSNTTRLPAPTPGRRYLTQAELGNIRADLGLSIDVLSADTRSPEATTQLHALFNASRRLVLIRTRTPAHMSTRVPALPDHSADTGIGSPAETHPVARWVEAERPDFVLLGDSLEPGEEPGSSAQTSPRFLLFQRCDVSLERG